MSNEFKAGDRLGWRSRENPIVVCEAVRTPDQEVYVNGCWYPSRWFSPAPDPAATPVHWQTTLSGTRLVPETPEQSAGDGAENARVTDGGEALLPCPFCDGAPRIRYDRSDRRISFIKCDECDSKGTQCFGEDLAASSWNTRAIPPAADPLTVTDAGVECACGKLGLDPWDWSNLRKVRAAIEAALAVPAANGGENG